MCCPNKRAWHSRLNPGTSAIYTEIVGPDAEIAKVHAEMKRINYTGNVFTLIMQETKCDQVLVNDGESVNNIENINYTQVSYNNKIGIEEEVQTYEDIRQVDPHGEFTPLLLNYCRMQRGQDTYKKMIIIMNEINWILRKDVNFDNNGMKFVEKMKSNNNQAVHVMYVTDCGDNVHDLTQLLLRTDKRGVSGKRREVSTESSSSADGKRRAAGVDPSLNFSPSQSIVLNEDAFINATRALASNYQKLSAQKIGHFDMHLDNFTWQVHGQNLQFHIIDFGNNKYRRLGKLRNFLHFQISAVQFDNIKQSREYIRTCDPVHYYMFVLCFSLMRRFLMLKRHKSLDNLLTICTKMKTSFFRYDKNDDTGRLDFKNLDDDIYEIGGRQMDQQLVATWNENISIFRNTLISNYGYIHGVCDLTAIWAQVCHCVYGSIMRYGKHETTESLEVYLCKPILLHENLQLYTECHDGDFAETYELHAFARIFDDFCMDFHNEVRVPENMEWLHENFELHVQEKKNFPAFLNQYYASFPRELDMDFLKKKHDEYSIARMSVEILSLASNHFESEARCKLKEEEKNIYLSQKKVFGVSSEKYVVWAYYAMKKSGKYDNLHSSFFGKNV